MPHPAASRVTHVRRHGRRRIALAVALALSAARTVAAQTDFYNTSVGRPLRIEDAVPAEYRAVELNLAPVRLDVTMANVTSVRMPERCSCSARIHTANVAQN